MGKEYRKLKVINVHPDLSDGEMSSAWERKQAEIKRIVARHHEAGTLFKAGT